EGERAEAQDRARLALPEARREDLQLVPVLGDGAAREDNPALAAEFLDDLLIREGTKAVLGVDDVLDHVLRAERRGEEHGERDDLARRQKDVLSRSRAAHRRLVHADALPHLRTGERPERLDAL